VALPGALRVIGALKTFLHNKAVALEEVAAYKIYPYFKTLCHREYIKEM
jgi:hypothetical protein